MSSLIIRGKKIFYKSIGRGLPIVFIHGSMGSHVSWEFQKPLADGYRLVLLDLPGHGGSDPLDGEISVKLYTDYVAEFVQGLGIEKMVVVGHSLGGAICIQLALDYTELLSGMVLVGSGAKLGVLPTILEALKTNFKESIELAIGSMAFAEKASPTLVEMTKNECLKCRQEVGFADFNSCNNFDARERLSEISVPTLIIVGTEDKLTPVKWSQYLNDKISDSFLKIIENAGHMVMIEQPEELNQALLDFLRSLPH
ncbi:MAG: alpha/beta fold hydrolase [Candidatus Jordarchaeum sp.]|uniref:alpha/beta fold hydrolase n=1 Tax=Candidatus Jordarchaeum sp. TaxID=2823881 RepID=UPI004048FB32